MIMIFYIANNLKTSVATDSNHRHEHLYNIQMDSIMNSQICHNIRLLSMTVYAFMLPSTFCRMRLCPEK